VRIDMPNPYSVYIHDTSHKSSSALTTASSPRACRCAEDPRAIAACARAVFSDAEIDPAIAKGDRTDIRLTHKVPVAWIYLAGWATRDNVILPR
jgi:murein L,D-transpeptidase YcbB/YkuD